MCSRTALSSKDIGLNVREAQIFRNSEKFSSSNDVADPAGRSLGHYKLRRNFHWTEIGALQGRVLCFVNVRRWSAFGNRFWRSCPSDVSWPLAATRIQVRMLCLWVKATTQRPRWIHSPESRLWCGLFAQSFVFEEFGELCASRHVV